MHMIQGYFSVTMTLRHFQNINDSFVAYICCFRGTLWISFTMSNCSTIIRIVAVHAKVRIKTYLEVSYRPSQIGFCCLRNHSHSQCQVGFLL